MCRSPQRGEQVEDGELPGHSDTRVTGSDWIQGSSLKAATKYLKIPGKCPFRRSQGLATVVLTCSVRLDLTGRWFALERELPVRTNGHQSPYASPFLGTRNTRVRGDLHSGEV